MFDKESLKRLSNDGKNKIIENKSNELFETIKIEIFEYAKNTGLNCKNVRVNIDKNFKDDIVNSIEERFKNMGIKCKYKYDEGDIREPMSYPTEWFVLDWN